MTNRDYPVAGLTVHWDSDLCAHSGVCASLLPAVFRPSERPWIQIDAASPDAISTAIDSCPSGALSYTRHGDTATHVSRAATASPATASLPPTRATITAHTNGPLEIQGEMTVLAADGRVLRESRRQYFCRCGNSANKPFCDGSHSRVGFRAE